MCPGGRKTYQPPLCRRLFLLHALCLIKSSILGSAFLTNGGRLSDVRGVFRQKTIPSPLRSIEAKEDVTVVAEKAASGQSTTDLPTDFAVSETRDEINSRQWLQFRHESTVFIEMTDM